MGEDNMEQRMTRAETRLEDGERRIACLEIVVQQVSNQNVTLAKMLSELEHINERLKKQDVRLEEIEKQPKARLNQIITALITGLIAAGIGVAVGMLMK